MKRATFSLAIGLVLALFLPPSPAQAQITTGAVTGRVLDAQGGVIPGATVILISETRGTKSAPVITNETGDYVFPNVTADRYTVEVTLEAFKTMMRKGIIVSGGDRVGVERIILEPGTLSETVTVVGESPLVQTQSGERSYAVAERAGAEPAGHPGELHQSGGVCSRRERRGRDLRRRHAAGRRQSEQHHDGRHLGHGYRQQRPDAAR